MFLSWAGFYFPQQPEEAQPPKVGPACPWCCHPLLKLPHLQERKAKRGAPVSETDLYWEG